MIETRLRVVDLPAIPQAKGELFGAAVDRHVLGALKELGAPISGGLTLKLERGVLKRDSEGDELVFRWSPE